MFNTSERGGGRLRVPKDAAEFTIKILAQENHTWQGTIRWLNTEKKEESFRSALELIRLVDSALNPPGECDSA